MTLCVTAFDRSGERNWCEAIASKLRGSRVFGIFIFDDELVVNACEFTPCYDMTWVGHVTVPSDELETYLDTLSREDRDEFFDYEYESEEGVMSIAAT